MPRKQRFKPSRKPKPAPQTEAAAIGHDARSPSSHGLPHNENVETSSAMRPESEEDNLKPETDPR